jgi:hypothetical protein
MLGGCILEAGISPASGVAALAILPLGAVIADCATTQLLTGVESCTKAEGKTIGLILTDVNAVYSTDQTAFIAALKGYVDDTTIQRIYPINNVLSKTVSGGDVKTSDMGYSGAMPIGLNPTVETYAIDGGDCLYKQLTALNGRTMRVFRVDDANFIYGTTFMRDDTAVFAGYKVKLQVSRTVSDGTNAYVVNLSVYYLAGYDVETKNMTAFGIDEIPQGLVGVELVKHTNGASVVSTCSSNDYTADYGDDWDTTMFVDATGANPNTVSYNATTGLLAIKNAGSYKVAKANVLKAGGVYGLEGVDKYVAV